MTIRDVLRPMLSKAVTVPDAVIVPWQRPKLVNGREITEAGVLSQAGAPIDAGVLANFRTSATQPSATFADQVAQDDVLTGRWLFGGLCCDHFGHFITNSMGRLWAADLIEGLAGIAFIADRTQAERAKIYDGFQPILGLPAAHCLCLRPTRVEELIVVPDLFSEGRRCEPAFAFEAWTRSKMPRARAPEHDVYITRGSFDPTRGRILCEEVLEENFRAAGYKIFAPETVSLQEQIDTYASARHIVGSEGSGLHLAALAAGPTARITCIQRRPELQFMLKNQLGNTLQHRFQTLNHLVRLSHPAHLTRPWVRVRSAAELDFDALREDLVARGLVPAKAPWRAPTQLEVDASRVLGHPEGTEFIIHPADQPSPTFAQPRESAPTAPKRNQTQAMENQQAATDATSNVPVMGGMNYLRMIDGLYQAIQPEWYLEIGTNKGASLERIDCNFVAVDPNFVLSSPIKKAKATDWFLIQKTSDDFFASGFCERNGITFDLAFLDGLHEYETLLRDFMNAEKLMAPGGTILLHDCCPTTLRMAERKQVPGAWTGDVWKTLLILLELRPDLDIRVAAARPTGLVVIRNMDKTNTVLEERYDEVIKKYQDLSLTDLPGGISGLYEKFRLWIPWKVIASY